LPVDWLACLSGDCTWSGLCLGFRRATGAALHVLDPELCHRHSAARSADAALTRRRLSRVPGAYQQVLPDAADQLIVVAMNLIASTIAAAERIPLPDAVIRA